MWKFVCEKYNKSDMQFVKKIIYGALVMGLLVITLWIYIDSPVEGHFRELGNNDAWFGDNWYYVDNNASVDMRLRGAQ